MKNNEKRNLTEQEKKRKAVFEKVCKEKQKEGYKKTDLTLSATEANIKGVLYAAIFSIPFIAIFFWLNKDIGERPESLYLMLFGLMLILAIIVHEGIHGFFWGLFAKKHWKSISFGVIWESFNPYCTCNEPLSKTSYIIGSMMPGVILGVIPSIISIVTGNFTLLLFGVLSILGAGGDLLVIILLSKHKSNETTIFLDHPTAIGLVCFEKTKKKK